jgi:hypothetical protein
VTGQCLRYGLALADGIIDLIAAEIAARGTCTVTPTPAERQLAAAQILVRGGTPYLISKRLQVSGTAAHRSRASQAAALYPRVRGRTMTPPGDWGRISRQERIARATLGMPAAHPDLMIPKPGRAEWKLLAGSCAELWPHEYTSIIAQAGRQYRPPGSQGWT